MARSLQDLNYQLLYKFKSLYPFDESALDKGLGDKGYQPTQMTITGDSGKLSTTGRGKATPEGTFSASYFDNARSNLIIQGNDFAEVNKLHSDFEDVLYHIDPDLLKEVAFLEINCQFRVRTRKLPLQAVQKFADRESLSHWEKFFGVPVGLFSLRLTREDVLGVQKNIREIEKYFEVKIEPMVLNPTFYIIQIIFRDPHLSTVKEIAQNIERYIDRLFDLLEGNAS